MKKIIAILIMVAVLLSVSVIAINAVGSDNIELPETDTTATEVAEAGPETTETVETAPETTAVPTEPETTPPLETEPDVTEPIQLTEEQLLAGEWVEPTDPLIPTVYFICRNDRINLYTGGFTGLDYFYGEIIKSDDGYVSGNNFVYQGNGVPGFLVDATICFTDDDTFVLHLQNEEKNLDLTLTYVRWSVPVNPEIGRDFVTGTFRYTPDRIESTANNHLAKITFNEDMTMYLEPYTDEDSVRINGTYEIVKAEDLPQIAKKVADGVIKKDTYFARVTVNEEELGTVQMPTVSYYKLETERVILSSYHFSHGEIIIDSDELETGTFCRVG